MLRTDETDGGRGQYGTVNGLLRTDETDGGRGQYGTANGLLRTDETDGGRGLKTYWNVWESKKGFRRTNFAEHVRLIRLEKSVDR